MNLERFNKYIYLAVCAVCTLGLAALFVALPQYSSQGVKSGLLICAQTVVPSLFPFCVLSSFFVKTGLCSALGRLISPFTKKLFALPGEAGGIMIMGLCGGFPVGASMTAALLEDGVLSRNDANRLMMFCVNAGPAFVIGAVGAGMLGSVKAGVILFLSLSAASLAVGFLTRFIPRKEDEEQNVTNRCVQAQPIRDALPSAVADGTKAMISICAWVVLFSCLLEYVPLLGLSRETDILLNCVLEVTRGCVSLAELGNIPVLAAALGWSGLSVHCQVMRYVKAAQVPFLHFVCARIINGALACVICAGLLKVFPCTVTTFAQNVQTVPIAFSFSAPAAAAMLFMGALLILELDSKRKKC
ncbi:MAG: hypothetical protein IJC91_00370 [Oscillospiraceae bacterium]|nr:hypothetical protein [Oscillospiraceae bacterium]